MNRKFFIHNTDEIPRDLESSHEQIKFERREERLSRSRKSQILKALDY